jgi:mannose-1-phosphate guanylyltransferase
MKAILLAAGFGTRLRPLTNDIPKCLVPINGKPLLQIWLENLTNAGVNSFLINTHYLSNQVNEFITFSKFHNKCILNYEEILLGTAGTLLNNLDFIGNGDCLLIHADNYCLADFNEFQKAHNQRPKDCLFTLMLFESDTPTECGIVEIDSQGVLIGFHEKIKNPPGNLANGAVYLLSHEFISILIREFANVSDFSNEVLPRFLGKIYTYRTKEIFIDIGTPKAYLKANNISLNISNQNDYE